jgi:hypothetical protein
MSMPEYPKNKVQINATVSPYLKDRCKKLADRRGEFINMSEVVQQALAEFFARRDFIAELKQKK